MKYLKLAPVFLAATIGGISSAIAGVSGAVTTTVEPLSGTVTYRTTGAKGLTTKVGYKVTISRSGTNTVNNVVFKGNTSVFKSATPVIPEEENKNESAEFDEADDDGGFCGVGAVPTEVVCNFGQMRTGDSRTFAVFFKGPVESSGNCFEPEPNAPSCEVVRFKGATNYSEGNNDGTGSFPNDANPFEVDVPLGTNDPTNVKSALSKSGGEFFTGTAGEPSPSTFPFAVRLTAPDPNIFSSVSLNLKKLALTGNPDEIAAAQDCMTAGNFNNCYQADVLLPGVVYLPGPNYLTIILLIDSTEVKTTFREANVKVYDGSDGYVNPLPPCASGGLPPTGEPRCVAEISRYGNASRLGELRRDVKVVLHALKNGPFRTR